jgi:HTH-type transcriptional regulator/antitoxin HigA
MTHRVIHTKSDYQKALSRLEVIFDAKPNTAAGDELELLSMLIEKYENEHFPIPAPNPIEAIKFRMEQMQYSQTDLVKILGQKSRVSEILNNKRKLSIDMIRRLHSQMKIPLNVLIQEY